MRPQELIETGQEMEIDMGIEGGTGIEIAIMMNLAETGDQDHGRLRIMDTEMKVLEIGILLRFLEMVGVGDEEGEGVQVLMFLLG
jgi:hypothetical protein